jgi:putative MFS transporter
VPELFPTELRLRGSGVSNTVGRAVSIAVPYGVAWAFTGFGIAGVLTLIVGTLLLQALIVGVLGAETRKRSLEAIAAEVSADGHSGDAAGRTLEGGAAQATKPS